MNAVTVFDAETPLELIKAIRPNVLVKGGDYRPEEVVGRPGGRGRRRPAGARATVPGPFDHQPVEPRRRRELTSARSRASSPSAPDAGLIDDEPSMTPRG